MHCKTQCLFCLILGNTGNLSTGEHLHFELWYKGEAVDPVKYIKF